MKTGRMKARILVRALVAAVTIPFLTACNSQTAKHMTQNVKHTEWSRNATIYEVNIRQYTPEGTFKAFEQHLPRLQKMGISILWLMPIQPIGEKNRKGTLGSYYSIKDYTGINPAYGTAEDFHALVNKAHELGMYVILDWVANHSAWDNPLTTQHPEWYKHDSAGNIISPVADWTDVAGLDYKQPGLRRYMTDALKYWIREFDIDGYRCDVAGMLPVDFWNDARPELDSIKPVFMLAEWETPEMHDTAFDATYSWDFYHLMNDIAKGKAIASKIDTLYTAEQKTFPPDAYRLRFTSNHDENSWNGTEEERMGAGAKAFAVLTFTFPGIPLVYSGQEEPLRKRLSFFEKDTIPWKNYSLESFYASLIHLKKDSPVLRNGDEGGKFLKVPTSRDNTVYSFVRKHGAKRIFVVLNLSPSVQDTRLTGSDYLGNYRELFTGVQKNWVHDESVVLQPWEYRVYVSE